MPITLIDEGGTRVCDTRDATNTVRFLDDNAEETLVEFDMKLGRSVTRFQVRLSDLRSFAKLRQPGGMFATDAPRA